MNKKKIVAYDPRAITINGRRELLLSGSIHYPRSTPELWPELIQRSIDGGLNTIETYVFWNLHERRRGVFDFSDRLDLMRFCRLVQDAGLNLILRIGPYICSETNYGGFPSWLREVPGIRMRTANEPFMREMSRWVRFVADYLRPMLASQGGPIILVQLENEYGIVAGNYGEEGRRYLKWVAKLGESLELGVPMIMCVGGAPGVLETINNFYGHHNLDQHHKRHPDQPALWTECWPGWADTWGYPHHTRTAEELAYAVARFFAGGGAGINYYMWHGGTNFGRETMYLQTTSYDWDAPLDEYGLPTTKFHHLRQLHRLLRDHAAMLLKSDRPETTALGEKQGACIFGRGRKALTFLYNDADETSTVRLGKQNYSLMGRSVLLLQDGRVLMDTAVVDKKLKIDRRMEPVKVSFSSPVWLPEPMPAQWPAELQSKVLRKQPIEQLALTHDETDYCWYTTQLSIPKDKAEGPLTLKGVADVVYIFIDGKLYVSPSQRLSENRGPFTSKQFTRTFHLKLTPGVHELSILCAGLGLIKGDWMIGEQNMAQERKGLWGQVTWNGKKVAGPWKIQPGLLGESGRYFDVPGRLLQWNAAGKAAVGKPMRWWRMTFPRPKTPRPLALDLQGMTKGMFWLNGQCLGRYWLLTGELPSFIFDPTAPIVERRIGEPTQRYYHVPQSWLKDQNELVLFEEQGGDPTLIQLCERQ